MEKIKDSFDATIWDEDLVFELTVRPAESGVAQESTLVLTQLSLADAIEQYGLENCAHVVPIAWGKTYKEMIA